MSETNQLNNNNNDTRNTKIFVGNLAWKTKTEDLRRYFERFGEVLDANVVYETYPEGRSKGYGFVTFRDAASADRALQDPNPIIDGRRTNCNLASLRAKNNMNPPKQNDPLNQVKLCHQYQPPSPLNVDPAYFQQFNCNPVWGQYGYMYTNPCCYTCPTQMLHTNSLPYMTQQTWHQTNTLTFAPQRSSAESEITNETDQEVIVDVANHDNEETVTKPDNDVDQQTEQDQQAGTNIGQDSDIKQGARDHKEKINEQEDDIKKDVADQEINGNEKDVENQKVKIVSDQETCIKQDEEVTKELNKRIEITLQDESVQDQEVAEGTK
ncbi:putative RNA-binding protein ARP1 [Cardamine amara subsp. amara]|uniref:RNA-binding protein ARP1 n=1 Tax=Cardamine amara subsp. amara TaxID=228776 RepID=A0ABD1AZI6_CARAN